MGNLDERLRALPTRWRSADFAIETVADERLYQEICADELEAALAALPEVSPRTEELRAALLKVFPVDWDKYLSYQPELDTGTCAYAEGAIKSMLQAALAALSEASPRTDAEYSRGWKESHAFDVRHLGEPDEDGCSCELHAILRAAAPEASPGTPQVHAAFDTGNDVYATADAIEQGILPAGKRLHVVRRLPNHPEMVRVTWNGTTRSKRAHVHESFLSAVPEASPRTEYKRGLDAGLEMAENALDDAATSCAATIREHEILSKETAEIILEDTERWESASRLIRNLRARKVQL